MNRKKIFCMVSLLIFLNSINLNFINAEDIIQNSGEKNTGYFVVENIDLNDFNNEITENTTKFLLKVNLEEVEKYLNEKISIVDKLYSSYVLSRNEYYSDNSNIESFTEMLKCSQKYYEADRAVKQMILSLSVREGYEKLKDMYHVYGLPNSDFVEEQTRLVNEYYSDISDQQIAENYISLIALRKNEAESAGFDSFANMAYNRYYNRNYSQKDISAVSGKISEIISSVSEKNEFDNEIQIEKNKLSQEKTNRFGSSLSEMPGRIQSLYNNAMEKGMIVFGTDENSSTIAQTNYIPELRYPVSYIGHSDIIDELGYFAALFYKEKRTSVIGMNQTSDDILLSVRNFIKLYYYYDRHEYISCVNILYSGLTEAYIINSFEDYAYSEQNLTVEKLNKKFYEIKKSVGVSYEDSQSTDTSWLEIEDIFVSPFKSADDLVAALRGINYLSLMISDKTEAARVIDDLLTENSEKSFDDILTEKKLITFIDDKSCSIIGDNIISDILPTLDDEIFPGDVNADRVVSVSDLILLRKYILLSISKEDISVKNADANKDGVINMIDYLRIVKLLLNCI